MNRPLLLWWTRAVFVVALIGTVLVMAIRFGGRFAHRQSPPRKSLAATSPQSRKQTSRDEADEVVYRFVETIAQARYDAPNARAGLAILSQYWRKMKIPWNTLSDEMAERVSNIALRTSATETQWAILTARGTTWAPDARIWNMNEGSFDQREAIVASTPSTVAFRIQVPPRAVFTFAVATANATKKSVGFEVTVVDARGAEHAAWSSQVQPDQGQQWIDGRVDLGVYSGQNVEVRLRTALDAQPASRRAPATKENPLGVAVGLWANPVITARAPAQVPYNVLWIVIDALRPDVLASFHDDVEDQRKRGARFPALEAHLPKVPGLMPVLDDLASRSVRFTHAYSGGAWTRPGTLSMLAGARATELGSDPFPWMLSSAQTERFYASSPPLLPLLLRRHGVATRAFVNNYFMSGYTPVGVDMGFERVADHRFRTRDTLAITTDAVQWLQANADDRFFVFCNYNSPHEPWEPPARFLARVPAAPAGPQDPTTRRYMAEAAKDDEAIGVLLRTLDDLGLRKNTIVVVTADHGETLSSAHDGVSALDKMPVRYHHAVSNYEETTKVPILLSLPEVLDDGRAVLDRVRTTDIAPTILELQGIDPSSRMSGKSLLPLTRGVTEPNERVVITEGRGTQAIMFGKYRLLVRAPAAQTTRHGRTVTTTPEELYDLEDDPGERNNIARRHPEMVAEMRARLVAGLAHVPTAETVEDAPPVGEQATLHVRFAGAGAVRRVSGTFTLPESVSGQYSSLTVEPIGLSGDELVVKGTSLEIALTTVADEVVGFDAFLVPPDTPVTWTLFLDERPWPEELMFTGPFGLVANAARLGITDHHARAEVYALQIPWIDPARDLGLFLTRNRGEWVGNGVPPRVPGEGAAEVGRLLEEWGYAHRRGTGSAESSPFLKKQPSFPVGAH